MGKFKASISSMRLRTLPLSLAGVAMGIILASHSFSVKASVVALICLTTVCLQVLSNLSNELGDVLRGTDTADREGPAYGLNGGVLTVKDMKRLIACAAALCCIFGTAMVYASFGTLLSAGSIALLVLGALAIAAAMKYTLGRNPYGYNAKGDYFVFIFFGLVSVMGSYYVASHSIDFMVLLPAAGTGLFSVGVLNVNNIRDMRTDAANRSTIALRLGLHRARIYQTVLICLGWICLLTYTILALRTARHFLYLVTLPLYAVHLRGVWTSTDRALDKYLPLLVMSTFILAILY